MCCCAAVALLLLYTATAAALLWLLPVIVLLRCCCASDAAAAYAPANQDDPRQLTKLAFPSELNRQACSVLSFGKVGRSVCRLVPNVSVCQLPREGDATLRHAAVVQSALHRSVPFCASPCRSAPLCPALCRSASLRAALRRSVSLRCVGVSGRRRARKSRERPLPLVVALSVHFAPGGQSYPGLILQCASRLCRVAKRRQQLSSKTLATMQILTQGLLGL